MGAPERFDHLRHSALDLLDAGNSSVSVARLLDVPLSVVTRWRDEPVPPRPDQQAVLAGVAASGKAIGFRTTLYHSAATPFRVGPRGLAIYAVCSIALGVAAWLRHQGFDDDVEIGLSLDIGGFLALLGLSRPRLVLGPSLIKVPSLFGSTTIAYADLVDWWLVLHVKNEGTDEEIVGRLLTLHSRRPGVPATQVFIRDAEVLDPQVIERLELVKQANKGVTPLTPLGSIPVR